MAGICGANRRQEPGRCQKQAGWGTNHPGYGRCRLHGGNTPSGVKEGARLRAEAEVVTYGLPREIDPQDALVEELYRTAGHVAYLAMVIGELEQSELKQYASAGVDRALVWEKPSVWLELYQRERKHFAQIAKTCIDVGIEERRVQIAEQQGQLIAQVLRGVLADLGVADHPDAPEVVRRHLTLVGGTQAA